MQNHPLPSHIILWKKFCRHRSHWRFLLSTHTLCEFRKCHKAVRWNRKGEDGAEKNQTGASGKRKSCVLKFILLFLYHSHRPRSILKLLKGFYRVVGWNFMRCEFDLSARCQMREYDDIFIRRGISKCACALRVRAHKAIYVYVPAQESFLQTSRNRWTFWDWTCFNSDAGAWFSCYIQMLHLSISKEFIRYFWINISSLVISRLTGCYIYIYILYIFRKHAEQHVRYMFSISRLISQRYIQLVTPSYRLSALCFNSKSSAADISVGSLKSSLVMPESNSRKKLIIWILRKFGRSDMSGRSTPRRNRDIIHSRTIIPRSITRQWHALTRSVLESTSIYPDFCLIDAV